MPTSIVKDVAPVTGHVDGTLRHLATGAPIDTPFTDGYRLDPEMLPTRGRPAVCIGVGLEDMDELATTHVRAEVSAFLTETWRGSDDEEWRSALVESGWAAPTWPVERFGRGLPRSAAKVVAEEFAHVGAPGGARS